MVGETEEVASSLGPPPPPPPFGSSSRWDSCSLSRRASARHNNSSKRAATSPTASKPQGISLAIRQRRRRQVTARAAAGAWGRCVSRTSSVGGRTGMSSGGLVRMPVGLRGSVLLIAWVSLAVFPLFPLLPI